MQIIFALEERIIVRKRRAGHRFTFSSDWLSTERMSRILRLIHPSQLRPLRGGGCLGSLAVKTAFDMI